MIKAHIKKHDQLSFELKLEFAASQQGRAKNRYFVNMFLFLPYALDINKHNYLMQDFYNSLKANIRLTTPSYLLQNIVKDEASPFGRLSKSAKIFIASPDDENKAEFELQIKRFCSIFGSSISNTIRHILSSQNSADRENLINEFVNQVVQIREAFKSLRTIVNVPVKGGNVFDIYQFADEYQGLLVEKHVFNLTDKLSRNKNENEKSLNKLNNLVLQEMTYREEMDYPSVAKTRRSNENVLHRSSRLKKFIESNLFLNTDTKKDGVIFEQLMFSLAAGLAMIFATSVAFASQMFYGNLTLPFFIALVISYMLKDRIKDLVRLYVNKKQHRHFHDFRTNIYNQKTKKVGHLKESFQFIKHKHLPEDIFRLRNYMRSTEISKESMGEKIILYSNKIKIFNNKNRLDDDFVGFTEILRLNISDFTRKMDDPEKEIFIRTKNGFKRSYANRAYHLNLIISYSDGNDSQTRLYKLIVHRNGIKRIEHIRLEKEFIKN